MAAIVAEFGTHDETISEKSGDDMLESGFDENVESLHSFDQENENNIFDWNHHDEEIGCES